MDATQGFLRYMVATIAYRGSKVINGAPEGFGETRTCAGAMSAIEIVAHMCDALEWAARLASGQSDWKPQPPGAWNSEIERFHYALKRLDACFAADTPACEPKRLIHGPLADVLTHIGQIALLRRCAGSPIPGVNYFKAEISVGDVPA
ncbi:MAG: hypothetical protein KJ052_16300 [Candidatus Hydrogenedentes bacterium]|nr:hypothetical protein [Candidatus Hydrogenedentota bacterium]